MEGQWEGGEDQEEGTTSEGRPREEPMGGGRWRAGPRRRHLQVCGIARFGGYSSACCRGVRTGGGRAKEVRRGGDGGGRIAQWTRGVAKTAVRPLHLHPSCPPFAAAIARGLASNSLGTAKGPTKKGRVSNFSSTVHNYTKPCSGDKHSNRAPQGAAGKAGSGHEEG